MDWNQYWDRCWFAFDNVFINTKTIQSFLESERIQGNAPTLLHIAVLANKLNIVTRLLSCNADINSLFLCDRFFKTSLNCAISQKNAAMTQVLLVHGGKFRFPFDCDSNQQHEYLEFITIQIGFYKSKMQDTLAHLFNRDVAFILVQYLSRWNAHDFTL